MYMICLLIIEAVREGISYLVVEEMHFVAMVTDARILVWLWK